MKQGPRWVRLKKKTRSRKSRATVPLKKQAMGKSIGQGKSFKFTKKGKTLTLYSNLELAVGDDVVVDVDVDE